MHDHSGSTAVVVGTTGVVAAMACAVCAVIAILHLRRLALATASRKLFPISVEAGHVAMAVGMAVMFAAPRALAAPGYTWAYLVMALVFLALIVVHPHSGHPSHWWCHSVLFVEAVAMAGMAGASGWLAADLASWFVVIFLVAGAVAAGQIVLRRTAFAGGDHGSPILAGSQLAMSTGMIVMLV